MSYNFGVVHSSAAATTGLNMPLSIEALIIQRQNAAKLELNATETMNNAVNSQCDATIAKGDADAHRIIIDTTAEITGSAVGMSSTMIGFGVGTYKGTDVAELNDEINNLDIFKGALNNKVQPNQVLGTDGQPLNTRLKVDPATFDTAKFATGSPQDKAALFKSKKANTQYGSKDDFYKWAAAEYPAADSDVALKNAEQLDAFLSRNLRAAEDSVNHSIRLGEGFSQSAKGLVQGSMSTQSAEAVKASAQEQTIIQQSEFLTNLSQTLFGSAKSAADNAESGLNQLIQNQMAIVRASSAAA